MSAEDNLDFYGRVWRMPATSRRARIQELMTHLGSGTGDASWWASGAAG